MTKVKIAYVGKLKDGSIFDTSPEGDYFEFTMGASDILPELQKAVSEMKPGETKELIIPSEKAYGKYDEDLSIPVLKTALPKDQEFKVNDYILYEIEGRELQTAKIKKEDDTHVYLDYNNPLAGEELHYIIKLIEILD